MFDIVIGQPNSTAPGHIALTVATEPAAVAIVGVLNEHKGSWLQMKGLRAFYRPVERGEAMQTAPEQPVEPSEPAEVAEEDEPHSAE
jgi:hypothetical protein